MLHLWRHPRTGEIRLYLRMRFSEPMHAWIAYHHRQRGERADWRIWIERPGAPYPSVAACQLLLKARSHLRAWLLRAHRRHLHTVGFADLCALVRKQN